MIDLDAQRAERREGKQDGPSFRLDGEEFTLPVEMSFTAFEFLRAGDLSNFMEALLGSEGYQEFLTHNPSVEDLKALSDGLGDEYFGSGEESDDDSPSPEGTAPKGSGKGKAKASKS